MTVAVLALAGCQDDLPTGPTTADFDKQRQELQARLKQSKSGQQVASAQTGQARRQGAAAPQEPSFGGVEADFIYDSAGKRDPFRSFLWIELDDLAVAIRGPLEQYDVKQLALLAIVWDTGNRRALVQDPSGQSFIIAEGTAVGKNAGRVTRIDDNLVVVKETYVNLMGQETTNDVEMRIRSSEGG
jgi:Tfp pilus assembly protein PilP